MGSARGPIGKTKSECRLGRAWGLKLINSDRIFVSSVSIVGGIVDYCIHQFYGLVSCPCWTGVGVFSFNRGFNYLVSIVGGRVEITAVFSHV